MVSSPERTRERTASGSSLSPLNRLRNSRPGRASFRFTRNYLSRQISSIISDNDLPMEKNAIGIHSPFGYFFLIIRNTAPLAYIYIFLIVLRELCDSFPDTLYATVCHYLPFLGWIIDTMQKSSIFVEIWAAIEAVFYIVQKIHMRYLQYKDPLEASLLAAPMLELDERASLWRKMMNNMHCKQKFGSSSSLAKLDAETILHNDNIVEFIRGWFFDEQLKNITKYDILDFCTWCMFEGRNQEHLTNAELGQLNGFVNELEWRISLDLYGEVTDDDNGLGHCMNDIQYDASDDQSINITNTDISFDQGIRDTYFSCDTPNATFELHQSPSLVNTTKSSEWHENPEKRTKGRKEFHFHEGSHDETPLFFNSLYKSFSKRVDNVEFHPVKDIRNFMAEKRQQLHQAEENAMAAATSMCENAYFKIIDKGSNVDKRLNAIGNATHNQLNEVWDSANKMKERIELQQQLKGYRLLLDKMREMSAAAPHQQMIDLMRKITKCNNALTQVEKSVSNTLMSATGIKNILGRKDPARYAKYSNDPLLGLDTYPLMFSLAIFGLTDGLLRHLLKKRGFERLKVASTVYYYHPGLGDRDLDNEDVVPFMFCHGIGVGLIYYLSLIDELINLGKPIFLPEIPYVCGFRPWLSRKEILTPNAVASTLTSMLATHGYLKATFIGHSYGTSWLSFMCKYAQQTIYSLLFLDPICFCLHHPTLTKSFVYHRPDPGSISHIVKTDVIVNWTIQRGFPWPRIILFIEDMPNVPCAVYLSSEDALAPAERIENYFRRSGVATVCDLSEEDNSDESIDSTILVKVFRGDAHGDWCDRSSASTYIAQTAAYLNR